MPAKIIVIRHGETDSNKNNIIQGHLDVPLNKRGESQAKLVAETLTSVHIDAIYSSDLSRAVASASHTAKLKGKKVITTPLLRERKFGELEGISFSEAAGIAGLSIYLGGKSLRGREKKFNMESDEEILARAKEFKTFLSKHKGETVAIFTHGGFIARFLEHVLDVPRSTIDTMKFPNAFPIILVKKGERYEIQESSI